MNTSNDFLSLSSSEDDIRRLLRNHVRRHSSEGTRNLGEDTSINNPQSLNTTDLELRVKNSHLIVISTNRAGRRAVVTPSSVLGILGNLLGGVGVLAGENFVNGDELALERVAGEVDSLGEGSEILLVVANTGVEVVVSDLRDVERVGGTERNGSGVVAWVRLEDGPCEPVMLGGGVVAVAGEVTAEVDGAAEGEDVVLVALGDTGLVEHGGTETGGSVDAAVAENGVLPTVDAGVIVGVAKGAAVQGGEVRRSLALDVDLVVVLEVGSDTGEVSNDGDVELVQLVGWADTTELEELGRVVGSSGDDDLFGSGGRTRLTSCAGVLGAGLVEVLAVEELNTGSAGRSNVLVEGDLGDVAVESDIERVLLAAVLVLCVADSEDELAGTSALAIGGRERDLVESVGLVTALSVGVSITSDEGAKVDNGVGHVGKGESGTANQAEKLGVRGDDIDGCVRGSEPSLVTVALLAGEEVVVVLELFEVLAHVLG